MLFETLILRPTSGKVDVSLVCDRLDTLPYAFHDPIEANSWHLSATQRFMLLNKEDRLTHPNEFPMGLIIKVIPEYLFIAAKTDACGLARGLEFLQWLNSEGDWLATVDGIDIGIVDDPVKLFPSGLPHPTLLIDDPLVSPVISGQLITWRSKLNGESHVLSVHSSGSWCYETSRRNLKGQFSPASINSWNSTFATIDPDDPELPDDPDQETAISIDIETPEDSDWIYLDTINPPTAYRSMMTMVTQWLTFFEQWEANLEFEGISEIMVSE